MFGAVVFLLTTVPASAAQTLASLEGGISDGPAAAVELWPFLDLSPAAEENPSLRLMVEPRNPFELRTSWQTTDGWAMGGSLFNPVDFESLSFGLRRPEAEQTGFSFDLDHPSFLTAGLGYQDRTGWRFGAEIHCVDLVDTGGLDAEGYSTDLNSLEVRWNHNPVVTLGGVVPVTEDLNLCSGFTWNHNPVDPLAHAFNAMAPGLMQSRFSVGLRWRIGEDSQAFFDFRRGSADYLNGDYSGLLGTLSPDRFGAEAGVTSLSLGFEISL